MSGITVEDDLIGLAQARDYFPKINNVRPAHSSIYQWADRGCRGVKLETFCVGKRRGTTKEAINRFLERTQRAK